METFFHVVAESARSAAGAGQDGQNDAFKDVHMWLQDFSNAEKADSLSRPDMCTCVANFCHAAQTAEADLLAKVVQAGLQNASHFFAVIRELKEVAFPKLWDLLKSKLGKTFVQNQAAYRDAVSDSFLPTEAGWADLSSTAASAAGMWQSMKPLAKVLAKENELPEMQGQFLQSEILRCCCVFMQRKASSNLHPDYATASAQSEGLNRLIKDADTAVTSLQAAWPNELVPKAVKDQAIAWFQQIMMDGLFETLGLMEVNFKEAFEAIPKDYVKMIEPDTRDVAWIKANLFNRKTHATVTMWNDDLYAAVKGLTDACKKWQSPPSGIVTGAHMKILKKYDTMSTSIRTYCILDPDLISWVGWFS